MDNEPQIHCFTRMHYRDGKWYVTGGMLDSRTDLDLTPIAQFDKLLDAAAYCTSFIDNFTGGFVEVEKSNDT